MDFKIQIEEERLEEILNDLKRIQNKYGFLSIDLIIEKYGTEVYGYLKGHGYLKENTIYGKAYLTEQAESRILKEDDLFPNVYGWDEYKKIFTERIKDSTHGFVALLYGASRVGKSEFLYALQNVKFKRSLVFSLSQKEFSLAYIIKRIKEFYDEIKTSDFIMIFDEIDKVPLGMQVNPTFYRLFDSDNNRAVAWGKATPKGDITGFFIPLRFTKIFAGANDISKIDTTLLNRFQLFPFPEYTQDKFFDVGMQLCTKKIGISRDLAEAIVNHCWEHERNMTKVEQYAIMFKDKKLSDFLNYIKVFEQNLSLLQNKKENI